MKHLYSFESSLSDIPIRAGELQKAIEISAWHQAILSIMPDYKMVKCYLVNDVGGLGYTRFHLDWGANSIKGIVKFTGIPNSEVFTHELLHFFTIPALNHYKDIGSRHTGITGNEKIYSEGLIKLYQAAKREGYSAINHYSIVDNLNEFAVNITNQESSQKLDKIGIYNRLFALTKWYLSTLSSSSIR